MTKISRRSFMAVAGGVTAATVLTRPLHAATTFRLATNFPSVHPVVVRLQQAADAIKADTNGAYRFTLFPNSQLGGDLEVLTQLRSGAIQFYPLAGAQLSTLAPVASLNGVGFAFNDMKEVWGAVDGQVGAVIRTGLTDAGLVVFDKMFDNGFRQITSSSKPVEKPADLANLHIRVPPSPLSTSLFKAFGAAPQSISFGEVYTALQTKLVDAQENPLPLIDGGKFYEVQKYLSLTNHMWDGLWMLANKAAWEKLPQDVRTIIDKRFAEAALQEREDVVKLNETLVGKLNSAGMTVIEPDRAAFRSALAATSFYSDWKAKFGPTAWSALEQYAGPLG